MGRKGVRPAGGAPCAQEPSLHRRLSAAASDGAARGRAHGHGPVPGPPHVGARPSFAGPGHSGGGPPTERRGLDAEAVPREGPRHPAIGRLSSSRRRPTKRRLRGLRPGAPPAGQGSPASGARGAVAAAIVPHPGPPRRHGPRCRERGAGPGRGTHEPALRLARSTRARPGAPAPGALPPAGPHVAPGRGRERRLRGAGVPGPRRFVADRRIRGDPRRALSRLLRGGRHARPCGTPGEGRDRRALLQAARVELPPPRPLGRSGGRGSVLAAPSRRDGAG